MHRRSLLLSVPAAVLAAQSSSRDRMNQRIRATLATFQGTVSLYAKNLATGAEYGIREGDRVRTASTIKLPIMTAVFNAVAAGRVKWTDESVTSDATRVGGSGVLHEFSNGVRIPLRDLVHLMIVVSDNMATNMVLDHVSTDEVNAYMDTLGLPNTRSLRKVSQPNGISKAGKDPENRRFGLGVSTPHDMAFLLEKIARGEMVSPDASKEMLAILTRQQLKEGIGRRLPYEQVASKSGALDHLRSDIGIVSLPHAKYALAITVDDMPKVDYSVENVGNKLISELTQMLLEGLR